MLSHRNMQYYLLFRVIRQCETVFLYKMAVWKVSIADAKLLPWLDFTDRLEGNEALVLHFVVETIYDAVRYQTVIDVVKQWHHHKDRIRVICILVRGVVEDEIATAHGAESPAPLFEVDRNSILLKLSGVFTIG